MSDIDFYKLDTAFALLTQFDHCARNDDFIEVSLWHNGEGFDAHLNATNRHQTISLTWGEYKALKTLVKKLDK